MIVTIKVTQECIDKGKRTNCEKCPVALAVRPLIKAPYFATVGGASVNIRLNATEVEKSISLPYEAACFINDFDAMNKVPKPFEFQIDIPVQYLERSTA